MTMTERQAEKWAVTRAKGRRRYIILFGVLNWGIFTAILWALLMGVMYGWQTFPSILPLAMIGFPIGGYLWGASMWSMCEAAYRKAVLASQPNSEN